MVGRAYRGADVGYPARSAASKPRRRCSVDWQELGSVAPVSLGPARAQAHWAAQAIAAAGETFLPHVPDTSHTAMRWDAGLAALAGAPLPGPDACRLALRLRDLTLLVVDAGGKSASEEPLAGATLAEAYASASRALCAHTRGRLDRALVHPGFELPAHPLAGGGRFEIDARALAELARWYADADLELRAFAARTRGAGPVLCWPHHFDLASLVAVEQDAAGEATKTIGVGLSPGDDFVREPYWYVNHGPEAESPRLPRLAAGEWFTDGWIGAVLRGSVHVAARGAAAQQALLRAYLASEVEASRAVLTAAP